MTRPQNPNVEILCQAADMLGDLTEEMVFVGGCAVGLLITDAAAPPLRVTRDVDAVVQVTSIVDYYRLADKLRNLGFLEDSSEDAPICRWKGRNIILDVMPADPDILGFGSHWYKAAIESPKLTRLPTNRTIRLIDAPHFLITKLDAFDSRGKGDYLASHDIEDIVAVIDGRLELAEEVVNSDERLKDSLGNRFHSLLNDQRFIDAVYGHMPTDDANQARVSRILKTISQIAEQKGSD